jgi:hypothetical protein
MEYQIDDGSVLSQFLTFISGFAKQFHVILREDGFVISAGSKTSILARNFFNVKSCRGLFKNGKQLIFTLDSNSIPKTLKKDTTVGFTSNVFYMKTIFSYNIVGLYPISDDGFHNSNVEPFHDEEWLKFIEDTPAEQSGLCVDFFNAGNVKIRNNYYPFGITMNIIHYLSLNNFKISNIENSYLSIIADNDHCMLEIIVSSVEANSINISSQVGAPSIIVNTFPLIDTPAATIDTPVFKPTINTSMDETTNTSIIDISQIISNSLTIDTSAVSNLSTIDTSIVSNFPTINRSIVSNPSTIDTSMAIGLVDPSPIIENQPIDFSIFGLLNAKMDFQKSEEQWILGWKDKKAPTLLRFKYQDKEPQAFAFYNSGEIQVQNQKLRFFRDLDIGRRERIDIFFVSDKEQREQYMKLFSTDIVAEIRVNPEIGCYDNWILFEIAKIFPA